jgi:hypothetical protein
LSAISGGAQIRAFGGGKVGPPIRDDRDKLLALAQTDRKVVGGASNEWRACLKPLGNLTAGLAFGKLATHEKILS